MFIYMIGFFVMVPVALIACLVWPHVQAAISAFQGFILSAGTFGDLNNFCESADIFNMASHA